MMPVRYDAAQQATEAAVTLIRYGSRTVCCVLNHNDGTCMIDAVRSRRHIADTMKCDGSLDYFHAECRNGGICNTDEGTLGLHIARKRTWRCHSGSMIPSEKEKNDCKARLLDGKHRCSRKQHKKAAGVITASSNVA